jgi:hypothetical protein
MNRLLKNRYISDSRSKATAVAFQTGIRSIPSENKKLKLPAASCREPLNRNVSGVAVL